MDENEKYINELENSLKKNKVFVEIVTGKSKKSGKDYEGVKITIGDYETMVFPTKFELKYIRSVLYN